ncbi:PREDICTED: uncharacterized protein LOC105568901 isoform X2 [Vollenhovia emeryi]|uniref:uncharacterized protein LOC105568901 isoform X2 n=1 Tax=Vollenhovia emeryi TaxID=411798 RepID=UPI0005F4F742|nr:PREDICTED: uncharacterized protein LOC105568901 isoform X2 [Vollenhovia emeryi]
MSDYALEHVALANDKQKMGNSIDDNEKVILILQEERYEVEKQKLTKKSRYFAVLLLKHYLEYNKREHIINYDIPQNVFQNFISWIRGDKNVLTNATSNDCKLLDDLYLLLELSVLFLVDNLEKDITELLCQKHFMVPHHVLDTWLLTQELCVREVRDLAFAFCLQYFTKLPVHAILYLSRENFVKLIGNINIQASKYYLRDIREQWMGLHFFDFIPKELIENKYPTVLHSIISCEYSNQEQFIHCWDEREFFELTSFEYPRDILERCCSTGKSLEGAQITGRKYDLYLCGGEYGIGSGKFNRDVWRYSLITKKWYHETIMPEQRRHMITILWNSKLLLVGGVGQYRQKLRSVDIYDIYTGVWTLGSEVPVQFTSVPEHLIYKDMLIIYQHLPTVYVYFADVNVWEVKCSTFPKIDFTSAEVYIMIPTNSCYIDITDQDEIALKTITDTCGVQNCNDVLIDSIIPIDTDSRKPKKKFSDSQLRYTFHAQCSTRTNNFDLIPFFSHDKDKPTVVICREHYKGPEAQVLHLLHFHSIPIKNPIIRHYLVSNRINEIIL